MSKLNSFSHGRLSGCLPSIVFHVSLHDARVGTSVRVDGCIAEHYGSWHGNRSVAGTKGLLSGCLTTDVTESPPSSVC